MAEKEQNKVEAKEAQKSSPIKLILVIFLMLLILLAAGFFVFLKFVLPELGVKGEKPQQKEETVKIETDKDGIGIMYKLETFVVNLSSSGGRRFLKLALELELSSDKLQKEMEKRKPQIRDLIIGVLSSKSFDDVYTIGGKMLIRTELIQRINSILKNGRIMNIYFTEFVIQ